jgi:excisionase family DNA binding protein
MTDDGGSDKDRKTLQRLLTVSDVADYLQVPEKTVYQWNHKGTGPKPIKVGRHVRYRLADIDRWLAGR